MAKSQVPVWLTGTAIVVALGAGAVGGAMWGQNNARGTQLDANTAKIVAMYQTIDSQYYEQPNAKKLTDGAINGMLASLKDPYSTYLQTDSKAQLDDTISASLVVSAPHCALRIKSSISIRSHRTVPPKSWAQSRRSGYSHQW